MSNTEISTMLINLGTTSLSNNIFLFSNDAFFLQSKTKRTIENNIKIIISETRGNNNYKKKLENLLHAVKLLY